MIENFLRPARGTAEISADLIRILSLASVLLTALRFELTDAGIMAFTLIGIVGARFLGLRSGADIIWCSALLIAAWSNVFDLYTRISWWDVLIHVVCTGILAAGIHGWAAQQRYVAAVSAVPARVSLSITVAAGLAMSAVWEMVEWVGFVFITTDIFVTYHDTIGDMVAGGFGAFCAGLVLLRVRIMRECHPGDLRGSADAANAAGMPDAWDQPR